jgi:fucose 4-O-acetylase-like acetyltransferase
MSDKIKNRDNTIDIAKAIGIIFMVVGHCCAIPRHGGHNLWQMYVCDYIYTFHMPLFFFLSGYFFNKSYLDSKFNFIKKKISGLWMPYIKWTLVFTLLHNIFLKIGMYSTFQNVVQMEYSIIDLVKRSVSTLFFLGGDQLIGGFWFIPTLFYASIFSLFMMWAIRFLTDKLLNSDKERTYNILVIASICISIIISILFTYFSFSIKKIGLTNSTFLASSIFITGHLACIIYKKHKDKIKTTADILFVIIGTIISATITIFHPADFGQISNWYDIVYIWFAGCVGTWTWVIISKYISKLGDIVNKLVIYIGKNTMIILALHSSCFKIINLIKIYYYNLDICTYGSFPIIANDPSSNNIFWWTLYIISGVFIPIAIKWCYEKVQSLIKKA